MVDYKDDPYSQDEKAPVTWGTPEMYNQPEPPPVPPGPAPPSPTPGLTQLPVRENPFGAEPNAPPMAPNGAPMIPDQNFLNIIKAPPPVPMSTNIFNNREIDRLEEKKVLTADEASNLRQHATNESNIYGNYSQDQAQSIQLSRADLLKSQQDANARSEEIRNMVREQYYKKDIDPNRYWKNKTTGEKVLAGIGMLLSGAGSGLSGQPNMAMQVINNAIDRDINAQKANIEKNYKAIADLNGLNENQFNRELHKQVWENNYRNASLERIKLDLAKNAAQTTSQTVQNNAKEAIMGLTQQQDLIRNKQWVLGQQAIIAERARIRALEKDADTDIQKLVEKEGVDWNEAARAVYDRPRYQELVSMGRGTVDATLDQKNQQRWAQAATDLNKTVNAAKLLGITDINDPRYIKLKNEVVNDPKYKGLFDEQGNLKNLTPKVIVGPDMNKQLDIQKKQEEIRSGQDEKSSLGNVYSRALAYKDYFSNPQEGDITARLGATKNIRDFVYPKGSAYENNVNSWNSFVDTTMAPLMEKQFVKGKPGQTSLGVAKERYHLSVDMPDSQKKQIMQDALTNLDEALKIGGVESKGIKPTTNPFSAATPSAPPQINFTPKK